MSFTIELQGKNEKSKVLYIKDDETFEEIFVRLPIGLTGSEGSSYTWYTGPNGANEFSIKIENFPDEDNKKEFNVHTESVSFTKFYHEEVTDEIMAALDDVIAAAASAKKSGNNSKKAGQNGGKRKTLRNSH